MINKRLLIKNILAQNDENTFFDKKESLDLESAEGKAKFLKHVSALSNSNPENNSYLIIGVENNTNTIKGTVFIDDSKIQNLIQSNFLYPPMVKYENIYFPNLIKENVVGLLTISPNKNKTSFKKSIVRIVIGSAYYRQGSNSVLIDGEYAIDTSNQKTVTDLENFSKISLQQLLDDLFEFFDRAGKEYHPQYKVYKEQFVVCWSGILRYC
jgi:predicted HTH transcriptional regulator